MQNNLFITGNSSGLGRALTQYYLSEGWAVYGLSRRGYADVSENLHDIRCDLSVHKSINPTLAQILNGVNHLNLVILNAGILGGIQHIRDVPMANIEEIMSINVWANKIILDYLSIHVARIDQVVSLSSGAAISGSKGWAGYALSKSTLNMLTSLYAAELPSTHFTALAPGLIDTAMQDYLCDENSVSAHDFPSVLRLREARNTGHMPQPQQAAKHIARLIPGLKKKPSGGFIDIRDL